MTYVKKNNLPLDFISTHQYAGDPIANIDGNNLEAKEQSGSSPFSNPNILKDVEDGSILSGLRNIFIDKSELREIRNDSIICNSKQVKEVAKNLPVYYTEWNENATFSAYTNDTRKVSSFIIMTSLKVDEYVSGTSLWCFSDIFEELHMFNEEFHGGFGLLTKHGIPKPSYYALKFLASVGDERYVLDDTYEDITLAAFDKQDEIQILITRQNMKNLFDMPKKEIFIELNLNAESIVAEGITEKSGNPLKEYEKMDSPIYLSKKQIKEIKEKSMVFESPIEFENTCGKVSFKLDLGINDSYLVKIRKK